ncbi:flagellar basal body rod protein FlgB [Methylocaldum sp. 14B]|uniref:flagellar basal body rod protein FlgB n=1 Tax=Methylocaldum sp. 14B TaxID=1912213 RepID=UPI001F0AC777|nr:flagellar basal body rod protein FlgB [Methylocaldum sp. 14B]
MMKDKLDFNEVALSLRAYRQELLASNIANADTPNYKAVDFDFKNTLDKALAGTQNGTLALNTTSLQHLPRGARQEPIANRPNSVSISAAAQSRWEYGRVGCRKDSVRRKRCPLPIYSANGFRPLQRHTEAVFGAQVVVAPSERLTKSEYLSRHE